MLFAATVCTARFFNAVLFTAMFFTAMVFAAVFLIAMAFAAMFFAAVGNSRRPMASHPTLAWLLMECLSRALQYHCMHRNSLILLDWRLGRNLVQSR